MSGSGTIVKLVQSARKRRSSIASRRHSAGSPPSASGHPLARLRHHTAGHLGSQRFPLEGRSAVRFEPHCRYASQRDARGARVFAAGRLPHFRFSGLGTGRPLGRRRQYIARAGLYCWACSHEGTSSTTCPCTWTRAISRTGTTSATSADVRTAPRLPSSIRVKGAARHLWRGALRPRVAGCKLRGRHTLARRRRRVPKQRGK